jgi:hypothetical protein
VWWETLSGRSGAILLILFTEVPRSRGVLQSPYPRLCKEPLLLRWNRLPHGSERRRANQYMSRICIKMRSDQYAAPREHANREGYQELRPPGLLEELRSAWARCV